MAQIIILDGYTLNPGDLSWEEFNALGTVKIYDRTRASEVVDRCKNAEIVLTNKVPITRDSFEQLPDLKYIGVLATGYNIVDVDAASDHGVTVTNIPAYSTHSVAELAFGFILECSLHLSSHFGSVRAGKWTNHDDFSYTVNTTHEIAGKKLGIIGYGQIAKQVIRIARAFNMEVLVYTSYPDESSHVSFVSKEELFAQSDFISIHTSLRKENVEIVSRETLALMPKHSYLINTSRGGLINEPDLAEFLNEEKISGAVVDVLSTEPPDESNPLLSAKNCRISPHIAWATFEARQRLMELAISNIKAYLEGSPVNVVS